MTVTCFKKPTDVNHEIMHAFGFWHEHQRKKRDKYVNVGSNILEGKGKNFEPFTVDEEYPCAPYDIRLVAWLLATRLNSPSNKGFLIANCSLKI